MCKARQGTSLHHRAGRNGYNMFRYFTSLCRECHEWIHDNPSEAKRRKYILDVDGTEEDFEKALKE
jgi:hypothetical protein